MKRYNLSIVSILIFTMMYSCGTDNAENNNDTAITETDSGEYNIESDLYSVLATQDFNGIDINILGYSASQAYNDADSFDAEQTGEIIDDAIYQRNIDTEELLNVNLVYDISLSEVDSRARFLNGVYAQDQSCDIFIHKAGPFGSIITTGTLLPTDETEGINLDMPWYVENANENVRIGNRQYGIFSDACKTNITMCWTTVFNKRLVDDWKLENPYDLVNSGQWTMDKLISITKDVWKDLHGNNIQDEEDLYGFYTDKWATLDAYFGAHRLQVLSKDNNDFLKLDFYSEKLVESFEKVYELYWNNSGTYVDTSAPYEYRFDFADSRALFSPMILDYMISNDLRSMSDDYGILPYPKLNEAQSEYGTYLLTRTGMIMLPLDLADDKLDKVGYVIEALSAYSYKYLRPAIYEQSLTSKGVRDEQSLEMLDIILESRMYDFSCYTETGGNFPFAQSLTYRGLLGSKNSNITSYYEANLTKAENYIDDLVDLIKENQNNLN